ncbi:phage terminase large subunit [Oleisolibacter albus]|uniref:phage terminase large subunit n=1 Tax=Oleisolibacter albus TaxID=2171757 RepID=UPI000DF114CB|nr:phage terminase large subunit [Oleisolibacter albus]
MADPDWTEAGDEFATFPAFLAAWNAAYDLATPDIHQEMADWLQDQWQARRRDLLLLAFRDSGKSTIVGLFCAWRLIREPDTRILVLAAEQGLAKRMVRTVKRVLEQLRPGLKPARVELWGAEEFTVVRRRVQRDPSMVAKGIGANVTGCHADLVICDDVEVPNSCGTAAKRTELRRRLNELAHVLSPGGVLLYIGTPHTYYSIYAAQPRPELGEEEPFLAGFARRQLPIEKPDGTTWWADRFTPETLERIRRRSGEAKFQSQMLLLPRRDSDGRLDPARLRRYAGEIEITAANGSISHRLEGRRLLNGRAFWDPALGLDPKQGGDGSVVAILFTDSAGLAWLHRVVYLRVPPETEAAQDQCRQVAALCARFALPCIHVESNGLGGFLPRILRDTIQRSGGTTAVQPFRADRAKHLRILEAWEPRLLAGHLYAHDSVFATRLLQEMEEWRPLGGGADDGLDAVAGALLAGGLRAASRWSGDGSPFLAQMDFQA